MLYAHMHSQNQIVAPRCLRSSHHPRPCLALTPFCRDNVQHIVTFTKIGCTIMYCSQTIVCSHKCTRMGLWMIPLTPWSPTAPTALSTINPPFVAMAANVNATSSSAKYAHYVHQLLCSPPVATLLHTYALTTSTKLNTIPGLTLELIHSHLSRMSRQPTKVICIATVRALHQHTTIMPSLS
jgi:hypothetical protein